MQFIQRISYPGQKLQADNEHAVKEILQHANHFHLFDVWIWERIEPQTDEGAFTSELWSLTMGLLKGFDENVLKQYVSEEEKKETEWFVHCLFDKEESLRLLEFQKSIENQKTTD